MPEKILIITDNLRTQVNGVVTTFRSIEPLAALDGYEILYLSPVQFPYMNCPGYPEVKLALLLILVNAFKSLTLNTYILRQRAR